MDDKPIRFFETIRVVSIGNPLRILSLLERFPFSAMQPKTDSI
jgi:hypothetical protein